MIQVKTKILKSCNQQINLKRKSEKDRNSISLSDDRIKTAKKSANLQLQPIVLQASDKTKTLAFFYPMVIDRCLRKSICQYKFCKPIRNGNLIVMCKSSNQMKILLNQDFFFR